MKRLLLAALPLLAVPPAARAAGFSAIYSFGDSLSDAGNDLIATTLLGSPQPTAPYFQGRFSNGPNWVDDLTSAEGLGTLAVPSLAGGNDYAFGGSTTGANTSGIPNLGTQVGLFLGTHPSAPSSALYTVWSGANDIFALLGQNLTTTQATPFARADATLEAADIQALAHAGASRFIVPGVPPLGLTPQYNTSAQATEASALAATYDATLQAGLATVTGAIVDYLDTYDALNAIVAAPGAFGFTDVTHQCYSRGDFQGGGTACANPNTDLFWDPVHPTAAAAALTGALALADANQLAASVPEPAVFGVFGLAAFLMLGSRRRA